MTKGFLKLTGGLCIAILLIASAWLGTSNAAAQPAAQATMAATMGMMDSGAMMNEASACPAGLAEQMGMTMMATMEPAMMGTETAMMATMEPAMMGTESAMIGTMEAGMMAEGPVCLVATLSGAEEVPAADAMGHGFAAISIDPKTNSVGFDVWVSGIKLPAAAMHIHVGEKGKAGDVVVPASNAPDASGVVKSTTEKVDPALIQKILANPAGYYVNVHNADFPKGAVRGQLEVFNAKMLGMDDTEMMATAMATMAK
jgi:hypothetical protein